MRNIQQQHGYQTKPVDNNSQNYHYQQQYQAQHPPGEYYDEIEEAEEEYVDDQQQYNGQQIISEYDDEQYGLESPQNNFPEEYRGGGSIVPVQAFGDREGKRVQHAPEPEISESRQEQSLQSVPLRVNTKSIGKQQKQKMAPINKYEEEPYIEEE